MRFERSEHPVGTIGLFTAELARYPEFWLSLEAVRAPATETMRTRLLCARGLDLVKHQNAFVEQLYGEWLWILGDDHTFAPDLLLRLLAHQVDVVVPLVPGRRPPFKPVICHGPLTHNVRYTWDELPPSGLTQLPLGDVAGTAGMLIRKSVFSALKAPYFECGQWNSQIMGEDLWFCQKLADAGVPIHVDTDADMTHMTPCRIKVNRLIEGRAQPAIQIDYEGGTWEIGV